MKRFPLLAFSKDRPFVAPESSSPLPNRIAPVLRRSAATPPARSDLVVSHHFAGLLLVDPVRTVAAAHDPGVHRRFTRASRTEVLADAPKEAARFPRCVSALRSFPSADSCSRWTLWRHLAMRTVHAGRLSPPARLSPCSAARLAPSLEACESCHPEGPSNPHPKRSRAPKSSPAALPPRPSGVMGSFLLTPHANLAVFLHRRVRCATAVSDSRTRCSRGLGLLLLSQGGVSTSKIGSCEPAFRQ